MMRKETLLTSLAAPPSAFVAVGIRKTSRSAMAATDGLDSNPR